MKTIFKALAAFQQEVPVIHKGTEVYYYSYADLPAIFEVINPLLKKHGLGFTQMVDESVLKTIIFHVESGETLESNTSLISGVSLSKMNDFQVLGSQITYLRRYALSSILGLVTDKDMDASGEQDRSKKTTDRPTIDTWMNANTYKDLCEQISACMFKDDLAEIGKEIAAWKVAPKGMKKEYKEGLKSIYINKQNQLK